MDNASTVESTDTATESQNLSSDTANAKTSPEITSEQSERTFTQADMNRIVAREVAKAAKEARTTFESEAQKAQMSEVERIQSEKDAAETRATEAENRANGAAIRSAVTLALADPKLNARDAKALAKLIDVGALEIDGDDVTGIDAEIKRLRAEHPALFYSTNADGGARDSGAVEVTPGMGRLRNAYAESSRRK